MWAGRAIGVALAVAAGSVFASASAEAYGEEKIGDLELVSVEHGFTWTDQEGETAYHVSGYVGYVPSCANVGELPSVLMEFDEQLPANTTAFMLPAPKDERLTRISGLSIDVSALDAAGMQIGNSNMAATVETGCTPEEVVAAGMGPEPARGVSRLGIAVLAALGASFLAAGVGLRKIA